MIEAAAEAGADCAKFQMRDMDTLYAAPGMAVLQRELAPSMCSTCFSLPLRSMTCSAASTTRSATYGATVHTWTSRALSGSTAMAAGLQDRIGRLHHHDSCGGQRDGKPLICSTGRTTELRSARPRTAAAPGAPMCSCTAIDVSAPFRDVNLAYSQPAAARTMHGGLLRP